MTFRVNLGSSHAFAHSCCHAYPHTCACSTDTKENGWGTLLRTHTDAGKSKSSRGSVVAILQMRTSRLPRSRPARNRLFIPSPFQWPHQLPFILSSFLCHPLPTATVVRKRSMRRYCMTKPRVTPALSGDVLSRGQPGLCEWPL